MALNLEPTQGQLPWQVTSAAGYEILGAVDFMDGDDGFAFEGELFDDEVPGHEAIEFDGDQVIVVLVDPASLSVKGRKEDNQRAVILMGDVSDTLFRTPFEESQDLYNGVDRRGTPTTDLVDGDIFRFR